MEELEEEVIQQIRSFRAFLDNCSRLSKENAADDDDFIQGTTLVSEDDFEAEVLDWSLQYLLGIKCPSALAAAIARNVLLEIKTVNLEEICHTNTEVSNASGYEPVELRRIVISKVFDICQQWQDASENDLRALASHKQNVSMCAIKNSRRTMEDRHVVIQDLNILFGLQGHPQTSFFAVFDGHAGSGAACYSAVHLHYNIIHHPSYPHDIKTAMKEGFMKTDKNFLSDSNREGLKSGSTALCCLLRDRELYLAWLGDSQAILVREGAAVEMMKPHKPDREDERERIEKLGGCVVHYGTWRVNGTLAVSRAIGDADYKPFVCSEPDVESTKLDGTEDFIILACDGLWDVLQPNDVVGLVYHHLVQNNGDIDSVASKLVQVAKEKGSGDNITILAVFLRSIEQMYSDLVIPETPQHHVPVSLLGYDGIQNLDQTVPVNGNPIRNMVELSNSEAISFETFGSEYIEVNSPSLGITDPLGELSSDEKQAAVTTPNFPQEFMPEWGVENVASQGHVGGGDFASVTAEEFKSNNSCLDRAAGDFPHFENPFGQFEQPPIGMDNPFYQTNTVDPAFELSNAATGNFFDYKPDAEVKELVDFESGPGNWSDNTAASEGKNLFAEHLNKGLFDAVKPFQSNLSPDAEPFVMVTRSPVESDFPSQSMEAYIEAEPFMPVGTRVAEVKEPEFREPELQEPEYDPIIVPAEIPTAPPAETGLLQEINASAALGVDDEQMLLRNEPVVPVGNAQSPFGEAALPVENNKLPTFINLNPDSPLFDSDAGFVENITAASDQGKTQNLAILEDAEPEGDTLPECLEVLTPNILEKTNPFDTTLPIAQEVLTNVETMVSEVKFDYSEDSPGHSLENFKTDVNYVADIQQEAAPSAKLEVKLEGGSKDLDIPLPNVAVVDTIPDTVPVADDVEDDESEDGEEWKFYKSDATKVSLQEMQLDKTEIMQAVEDTAQGSKFGEISLAESSVVAAEVGDLDVSLPFDSQNSSCNDLDIKPMKTDTLPPEEKPAPDLLLQVDVEKPKPAEAPKDAAKPEVPTAKTTVKASAAPKAPAAKTATSKCNEAARKPQPKLAAAASKPAIKPAATSKPLATKPSTKPLAAKSAATNPAPKPTAHPPAGPAANPSAKSTTAKPPTKPVPLKKVPTAAEPAKKALPAAAATRPKPAPSAKTESAPRVPLSRPATAPVGRSSTATLATVKMSKEQTNVRSKAPVATNGVGKEARKLPPTSASVTARLATKTSSAPVRDVVKKDVTKTAAAGRPTATRVDVKQTKETVNKQIVGVGKRVTGATKVEVNGIKAPAATSSPKSPNNKEASPPKARTPVAKAPAGKSPILLKSKTPGKSPIAAIREKGNSPKTSSPGRPIRKTPGAATATITGSSPTKGKLEEASNEKGILDATSKEGAPTENGLENHGDQPNLEERVHSNGMNGGDEPESERLACDADLVLI